MPCTLLRVDPQNQLRDVARGSIVMPNNRRFHGEDMPDNVHRVRVVAALPGYGTLYPPNQPPEADKELTIGELKNELLLWPKSLIRLNPPSEPAASKDKVTPPPPPPAVTPPPPPAATPAPPLVEPMTQHGNEDYDLGGGDDFMDIESFGIDDFPLDPPARDPADHHDQPAGKHDLLKKKLFSSQETPEKDVLAQDVAFTAPPSFLSPGTCLGATVAAMSTPPKPKKIRKRPGKKNKGASTSNPMPAQVLERLPTDWRNHHVLGQPMVHPEILKLLTGDMRSLHDSVLHLENDLLKSKTPSYPLHVAKVPAGYGFVDGYPADLIFIRFDDIFNLFNIRRLHRTFIRLVALKMAYTIMIEKTPGIAVMDPFYMMESVMANPRDRVVATAAIENFMVENKDKQTCLMPYFAE